MALPFHTKVSLVGFHFEDFILTMNLTGVTSIENLSTLVGHAVSLDTSAANSVKLAADGDVIIGRIATAERRKVEGTTVAAVELKFIGKVPLKASDTAAVGDTVVGAGNGEVKKLSSGGSPSINYVVEKIGTTHVVVVQI